MTTTMTTREVADTCRVTAQTVRRWAKNGRLPAIRISRRCVRFDRDAVLRLLGTAE